MNKRTTFFLGIATYAVLLIFAAVFFKERTVFLDAAFHLFQIVKNGDFAIQVSRFGAVMTQIFPLLSVKLHLPLKWVMLNYSVGVVLYYFVLFLLCLRVFKSWQLALALLLFNTLMVTYTFYWIQIEFAQGIAFTFLFFAFLLRDKKWADYNAVEIALFFTMIFTLAYFHPLMPIVFTFISLFFLLNKSYATTRKTILAALLTFFAIIILKRLIAPPGAYDAAAMSGAGNIIKLFPHYFNLESNLNFLQYLLKDYYFLFLLLIAISIFYIRQKRWLHLLLVLSFFFGYLLLVNVSYPQGMAQFHIESFYLALSVFLIIPFIFDFLPSVQNRQLTIGVLSIMLLISCIRIGWTHRSYANRIAWEENLLEKTENLPNKKLLIAQEEVPMDTLVMSWGSSYEFWLLSSLKNPTNVRSIIIDENPSSLDWALANNKGFLTEWGMFDYKDLPQQYFNFQDTTYYQKFDLD